MKKNCLFVAAWALLCVGVVWAADCAPGANWGRLDYLNRGQIHRGGGRDTRPDNALETFLWCWGHGVAPEADVRLTKDGVAIALHDDDLRRIGRGLSPELAKTPVKDLNWVDIKDVDVGSYLSPEYASTRIATFESIAAVMAGRPERLLFVDEKGASPRQIAEIARRFGVERQVIYTSPHFQLMAEWQKEVPGGLGMVWLGTWAKDNSPTSVAKADKFLDDSFRAMAASNWVGISQVQIHVRTDFSKDDPFCPSTAAIRRSIALLHAKGITVQGVSWTEGKNPEVYRRLWDLGFDNLCSDDPLVLFDFLKTLRAPADEKATVDVPRIIFDTDMIEDFDDVGALACLHALADAGECEILATISSTRGNASVAAIEVINGYYGRGCLPVGCTRELGVLGDKGVKNGRKRTPEEIADQMRRGRMGELGGWNEDAHYKYRKLAADYPQWVRHLDSDDAPDANEVYRKILAASPDKSVVVCSVGFLSNMRRLLETKGDDISPLTGRELVARKVSKWFAMACRYPRGKEYNSQMDAESSRIALAEWPTPVVICDWNYGADVFAGRAIAEAKGPRNPVKDVFAGNIPSREEIAADPARSQGNCFGVGGRAAWDEVTVLAAVRGETSYFNVHRGEYRMVGQDGENVWVPDEVHGRHLRLTEKLNKVDVGKIIDELICRRPKN